MYPCRLNYFFLTVLFFMLTACSTADDAASDAIYELSQRYEAAILWDLKSQRPGLMKERDVKDALDALIDIRAELDAITAKFPETSIVADFLGRQGIRTDGISIPKIDAQIEYLREEVTLFKYQSLTSSMPENDATRRAFGFSFFDQNETECQKNAIDVAGVSDFTPRLQDGELTHFFIKFDSIIDTLIAIEQTINEAFNKLGAPDREKLGIELWEYKDNKSQSIYGNMFRSFINGYLPAYLENPEGVEVIPEMIEVGKLTNRRLIQCSTKDNASEFRSRVGSWLPKGKTFYLDVIGTEDDRNPVYVLLHGYASKSDRTELIEPVISGLSEKYGDSFAQDRGVYFLQQSWITDEGILIVLRFKALSQDPLSDLALFSLSYIDLPTLIKNYREYLDAYLLAYRHIANSMAKVTQMEKEREASEMNSRL